MEKILDVFFGLKLIDGLSGDDERYLKIKKAADNLSGLYRNNVSNLITAIVSGLNPKVTVLEPAIIQAKECLRKEWNSFETVYSDEPINLYRGIILEACSLVAKEKNNASIMWLTASDILLLLDLGKERIILQEFMCNLAEIAEQNNINEISKRAFQKVKPINLGEISKPDVLTASKTLQNQMVKSVAGAAGQSYMNTEGEHNTVEPHNRYWPNNNQHWAGDFAKIMSEVLAKEFDRVSTFAANNGNKCLEYISEYQSLLRKSIEKVLNEQRLDLQKQQQEFIKYQHEEQTRLNVLWWSEAFYSPSLKNSYRDYKNELVTVLMSYDLLNLIIIPTPASVGYMLSETLSKMPDITFELSYDFLSFLKKLREQRNEFPESLLKNVDIDKGQTLNIRDLVLTILTNSSCNDFDNLIAKSIVPKNWKCNLPLLSRIIFKQEQAYRLAEVGV